MCMTDITLISYSICNRLDLELNNEMHHIVIVKILMIIIQTENG